VTQHHPDESAPRPVHEGPPETGDIVIDAALRDLADTAADDLDGQLATGEAVHRTLQGRLGDLGG
jgi:hypothetical protein